MTSAEARRVMGCYLAGFALGRLLEYLLWLTIVGSYLWLWKLANPAEAAASYGDFSEFSAMLWQQQWWLWKNPLFWGFWLGAGAMAGGAAILAQRYPWLRRVLLIFSAAILLLTFYGFLMSLRGFLFEDAGMNFMVFPLLLVTQFCVSVLLSRGILRLLS